MKPIDPWNIRDLIIRLRENADHMEDLDTDYNGSIPLQREAANVIEILFSKVSPLG